MSDLELRAKEVFLAAMDEAPGDVASFLRRACEGDLELEERVRGLLAAHVKAQAALPTGQGGGPPAFRDELRPGARIGAYELVAELGEGGFGSVWRAEQREPVRRSVALKVLKAGMDTREIVARFEAERQALALMDHPSIARVFDGGATDRGRPFFAMELVDGTPITSYCGGRSLATAERLKLFAEVCRGVQHAHQKGVIHRDLKPSNVLVTEVDGRPVPKIIDFGIAKATGLSLTEKTLLTRDGQLIGTPTYMSPEQLLGTADVDTRSDVYSLGVLLYELLSGTTPFGPDTLREAGVVEIMRVIREVEPPKPSTRLTRRTDSHAPRTGVLHRHVRGDLDWIVMRCLEKDRERRYDSADVLAHEIQRHLRGEPVLAGPPSVAYRIAKFARRHRSWLAAAMMMVALSVGWTFVSWAQAQRAVRAEREARLELARFEAIARFLEEVLLGIDPAVAQGADTALLLELLGGAAKRVEEAQTPAEVEATLRRVVGGAYMSLARYDEAERELREAAEIRLRVLGPGHRDTLQSQTEYGALLLRQGRFDAAEALLVPVLERRRAELGPEHDDALDSLSQVALLRKEQRRFEEAEPLLRELLAARARKYGPDDDRTLLAENNLAGVLDALGRKEEAARSYERLLGVQLERNGELHPRTLIAYNNLGSIYMDLDDLDRAEPLLQKALEIKLQIHEPDHPSVVVARTNLAWLYRKKGDLERAEELHGEAAESALRFVGGGSPTTLMALLNHGSVLNELDRPEEAEGVLRQAAEAAPGVFGETADVTLLIRNELAAALVASGRADEAEPLARATFETAAANPSAGRAEVGRFTAQYGLTLHALGRDGEALPLLNDAFARLADGGAPPRVRRRTAEAIADIHEVAGRAADARLWRERAAE